MAWPEDVRRRVEIKLGVAVMSNSKTKVREGKRLPVSVLISYQDHADGRIMAVSSSRPYLEVLRVESGIAKEKTALLTFPLDGSEIVFDASDYNFVSLHTIVP